MSSFVTAQGNVNIVYMATQADYDRIQADIDDVSRRITALNRSLDKMGC